MPAGGSAGDVLVKSSGTDYATEWEHKGIDLLWTNPNPTNNWPSSQKISVDLSSYDAVFIILVGSTTYASNLDICGSKIIKVGYGEYVDNYIVASGNITHWLRHVTVNASEISFWSGATLSPNGTYTSGQDQTGIPLKVYGIKA